MGHRPTENGTDVIVVGAGVIGLATAWRCAQRGFKVTVVDPDPGRGASHYAAGMLAPVTEAHFGEEPLLHLTIEAARRYPAFVADLQTAAGTSVGYRTTGMLAVAFDNDDRAVLAELHAYHSSLGLTSTLLSSRECRDREPALAPAIRAGLWVAGDHQVDNRRLVQALRVACDRVGVRFLATEAHLDVNGNRVTGANGIPAAATVLAAGAWSPHVAGLPEAVRPPVRPVKGQILRLRIDPNRPLLTRAVRAFVRGRPLYVVPRETGEIVVGGTAEEMGFDQRVTVEAVADLLDDARRLVPGLVDAEFTEASAGLRPGSPDNGPMVGPSGVDGLVIATGHYRNGILLAPITADAVAELLATGAIPEEFVPFDPRRFFDPDWSARHSHRRTAPAASPRSGKDGTSAEPDAARDEKEAATK